MDVKMWKKSRRKSVRIPPLQKSSVKYANAAYDYDYEMKPET